MAEVVARNVRETEVIVVGAGPAGIAAATVAAEAGHSVLLLDEGSRAGGQIWRHTHEEQLPRVARGWLRRLHECGAVLLRGETVIDCTPGLTVIAEANGQPLRARATRALVLTVGARERFLPFPGWTLPGVVGVGGAQALLKAGLDVHGQRVVVGGSGPLLLPVAALLARSGARLAIVAEQTTQARLLRFAAGLWRTPARLADAARYRTAFRSARFATDTWVMRANGDTQVREAVLTDGRVSWTVPCDLLCVGYGLVPSTELPRQLGCEMHGDAVQVDELQQTSVRNVYCAGEPTGIGGVESALVEGQIAGYAIADDREAVAKLNSARATHRSFGQRLETAFALRPELLALADDETIVCRCEDATWGSIRRHTSMREAKLLTRAGMGPCQGRICGSALMHMMNWSADTVRTPVLPALVNTLTTYDHEPAALQPAPRSHDAKE